MRAEVEIDDFDLNNAISDAVNDALMDNDAIRSMKKEIEALQEIEYLIRSIH